MQNTACIPACWFGAHSREGHGTSCVRHKHTRNALAAVSQQCGAPEPWRACRPMHACICLNPAHLERTALAENLSGIEHIVLSAWSVELSCPACKLGT